MKKITLLKNSMLMLLVLAAITAKSQLPAQYLTWDAGSSGPGSTLWSQQLQLPWTNLIQGTGDWLDANQVAQGSTAYASTTVSAVGPVSFNVKALVTRWLANGANRGFYLQSQQSWPFYFDGRNCTTAANRPKLTIVTNMGTFTPTCIANAHWAPTSISPFDSRVAFKVGKGTSCAVVQFDLNGVKGTVQSATLTLNCTDLKYSGILNIFELNPPAYREGGGGFPPVMGIANGYMYDKNISTNPKVLFAADFSDLSKNVWNGNSGPPMAAGTTQIYDPVTQSTYYGGIIPKGETSGCALEHEVIKGKADGTPDKVETELYARYYVYLEDNWGSTVDANKMPGFDTRMGWWNPVGYWAATTGNGGSPGSGLKVWNATVKRWVYEGHSVRGHGGRKIGDGNPYDNLFWLGSYIYNLDQGGSYGEGVRWNGTVMRKKKWYCIEHYMKMNSISDPYDTIGNGTANYDGVYRTWVDGVLAYERTNLRWRRHPEMGIDGFMLNWYHGGLQPTVIDMNFRMNFVVIARDYIGPIPGGIPTSIDTDEPQIAGTSLHIYPNPAKDMVMIGVPQENLHAGNRLEVFNTLGQNIFSVDNITDDKTKIETGNFPKGMYIVKFKSNPTTFTGKFLVE